jgi:hypothetical protein
MSKGIELYHPFGGENSTMNFAFNNEYIQIERNNSMKIDNFKKIYRLKEEGHLA